MLYKPNFTAKQIVDQVQDVIDRIQKEGVPPEELQRVRATVRSSSIVQMQSALGRARLLAQYEVFDGNPGLINTELQKFLAVTPAQIQAVAKNYLAANKRSVLQIVPAPKPAGSARRRVNNATALINRDRGRGHSIRATF